jgi:hypothetical protein
MIGIEALVGIAGKVLDRVIPDEKQKAEAQMKLAELAQNGEIAKLVDGQQAHKEQQDTIRNGDNATDEYVRQTRPLMARQSWYGGLAYIFGFEVAEVFNYGTGATFEIAMTILAPALAYMGFRSLDKFSGWKK